MKNMWNQIRSLWESNDDPVEDRLEYKVSSSIQSGLDNWKKTSQFQSILSDLNMSYIQFTASGQGHYLIDFLRQDASNGFVLDASGYELSKDQCLMLLWHWVEILKDPYFVSMSDLRLKADQRDQWEYYRHYLKPSKRKLGLADQAYGNIELVVCLKNEKPQYVKVQCNAYVDQSYEDASDFGHLIFQLTQPNT